MRAGGAAIGIAPVVSVAWLGLATVATPMAAQTPRASLEALSDSIATLLRANRIPGAAATVVEDGAIVWSRGFGYADRERRLPATPQTPFRLASVSKPLAAVIIMQLVEEGRLGLDARMADLAIPQWLPNNRITARYDERPILVRHVLTHTSDSVPGSVYRYNGNVFADLTWVLEHVTRQPYPALLATRVFAPAGMARSAPGTFVAASGNVVADLAIPYAHTDEGVVRSRYEVPGDVAYDTTRPGVPVTTFALAPALDSSRRLRLGAAYAPLGGSSTAAGVISTAEDLARFDIALDGEVLLRPASREQMFTASVALDGRTLPYGLGWFVEEIAGHKIVWHYGWLPPAVSGLYIKVPEKHLTFILLANSDGLSAPYAWSRLGVRASPYARQFLQLVAGLER